MGRGKALVLRLFAFLMFSPRFAVLLSFPEKERYTAFFGRLLFFRPLTCMTGGLKKKRTFKKLSPSSSYKAKRPWYHKDAYFWHEKYNFHVKGSVDGGAQSAAFYLSSNRGSSSVAFTPRPITGPIRCFCYGAAGTLSKDHIFS